MAELSKETIYLSAGSRHRSFSCYEIDEKGGIVTNPTTGLPKKLYFTFTATHRGNELRVKDPVAIRSIDAWIDYHTQSFEKDGKTYTTSTVGVKKYSEAEILKMLEPVEVAMKDTDGNDVKVPFKELKEAWEKEQAAKKPEEKASTPVFGTRGSKHNPKGVGA